MVNVKDTQIKNIGFNTSADTGTKVRSGGEALAKIVTGAIGAKKSLEYEQAKVEQAEAKESNLLFNDLKIDAQKRKNEYDFQDPSNPTSSELMDLYDQTTEGQKEVYGMLHERDRQAYDLYYAQRDGDVKNLIGKEAKGAALTLTSQSLQNFKSEEHIDRWVESMEGMVSKKELFEIAGKNADSLLATGALDNLSTAQLNQVLPYMNLIKDPAIGAKFKSHVVELKKKEGISASSHNGKSTDAIATEMNIPRKKVLETQTAEVNKLVGSGNPDDFKRGIEIANHNGIRIEALDLLPSKITSTIESDTAAAVEMYKQYEDTKGIYPYTKQAEESLEAFRIVGTMHGIDLGSEEGMKQALHYIQVANSPDAPKITAPTDDEIIEAFDPTGLNFMSNMREDEFGYIAPRVRELMKYTGGDIDKAMKVAKAEFDSFDNNASPDNWGWFDETPYGMFAKSEDELTMVLEQFSPTTDADDVEIKYVGGDKWSLSYTKDDGSTETMFRSARELKAAARERQVFHDGLKTLDVAIGNEKLGESLRDKQITSDAKEVKSVIDTQRKAMEERLGEPLNSVQVEELNKEVIKVLKNEVKKADLKEKGGLTYDSETSTVTFSFGKIVEDVFSTMMGVKVEDTKKEEEVKNKSQSPEGKINIAPTDEIMGSILEAELGGGKFVEGQLHVGQENLNGGNGEPNTTNYGVVITAFPKNKGESDLDHAKRYYSDKVVPALSKVKGIETASSEVIMGLSKLVWNKGNIVKKLDLNNTENTIRTLLDVTTTGGKHSNGVINRTIGDYSMVADALNLPKVSYVRTTKPKANKYKVEYLDKEMNVIYADDRNATTAKGSRISAGKTYNVIDNSMVI